MATLTLPQYPQKGAASCHEHGKRQFSIHLLLLTRRFPLTAALRLARNRSCISRTHDQARLELAPRASPSANGGLQYQQEMDASLPRPPRRVARRAKASSSVTLWSQRRLLR